MCLTRVKQLSIQTFRRFHSIDIPFGKYVTLIAGQNGTSKSTLLGMLAQPFSFGFERGQAAGREDSSKYTETYHGTKLHEFKDMTGKSFMYDCNNVFRLSRKFDFGKKYTYETHLDWTPDANSALGSDPLVTQSRDRRSAGAISGIRFVTGPGLSHESGEGNFPHPVIYLGLNRLWPLAASRKCNFTGDTVTEDDKKWYFSEYNRILGLGEKHTDAQFMDTHEKRKFITPHSQDYDGESCSAGQDNLSQILTALLSFKRLREQLGAKYRGGMLLIDEIDATLHIYSQRRILKLLCDQAQVLGIQIVATTHSLSLLEEAFHSSLKRSTEVIYLSNIDGEIALQEFETFEEISNHLKVEVPLPKKNPQRVSVVFEDQEGEFLFKQICGQKLRNYIKCANSKSIGAGQLKNIGEMSRSLPELKDLILVTDGDMASTWQNPPQSLIIMPGDARPETLVYRDLYRRKESDPLWKIIGKTYRRQFAIISQEGTTLEKGDNKDWVKSWYANQRQYWGRGNAKVFNAWVAANKSDCFAFTKNFIKLLRARYKGEIPKDVIDRALAPLK